MHPESLICTVGPGDSPFRNLWRFLTPLEIVVGELYDHDAMQRVIPVTVSHPSTFVSETNFRFPFSVFWGNCC
jgi:hypothetical protein